jgi:hypothetical protein
VSRCTVQRELKQIGYKSTLPFGTPMLTEENRDARVPWKSKTKTTTVVEQYSPMKPATNCFEIPYDDDREFQITDRRLWYGVASASMA